MTHLPLASTIYHEDWWLNAAAYGDYEVAEVLNGGYVVGRLSYRITRRFGMKRCTEPESDLFSWARCKWRNRQYQHALHAAAGNHVRPATKITGREFYAV